MALVAAIITLVAIVICGDSVERHSPDLRRRQRLDQGMSYTAYDSAMMAIIGSTIGHLAILAFLGIGLAIRSARGVISGDKWYQVRLVRYFWVWVAISSIVVTLITTTINTVH